MKLRTSRRTATVLTMAVNVLGCFFRFLQVRRYPIGIVQGNIPAQGYVESVITVTEKMVNVKWGNTQPTNSKLLSLTVRRIK